MKRIALSLFVLLLTLTIVVSAQVTKGSISGTVQDPSGAVIADANVKATAIATGVVLNTTSDKNGNFRFSLIPPGTYEVEVAKQGFTPATFKQVDVTVGNDKGLGQVTLKTGAVTTEVNVSVETPLIETSQAQVTSSFDAQKLTSFAGVGENQGLDVLALQVPGVVNSRDANMSNSNGAYIASNGLRGRNNDQQIDGQNNNDNSVGGPALQVSNAEFVDQYAITTTNFGPEYGRNSGSVVNIITKAGTNNFHGSVFGTENNSVLNSLNNVQKADWGNQLTKLPRMNDEMTGFTLGGPVLKNRLFFFSGFDQEMISQKANFTTGGWVPTAKGMEQLKAMFGNTATLQAYEKYGALAVKTGNPTLSNVGNVNINPAAVTDADKIMIEMGKVTRVLPQDDKRYDLVSRVDYAGQKDNISIRYMYQLNDWVNVLGSNSAIATGYTGDEPARAHQFKTSWTRNLSNSMVNEAAITFGRNSVVFGGGELGTIPDAGGVMNALASISMGSKWAGFGPANTYPQSRIVNTWQFQDNFNWMVGRHQIKAGINWTYQRSINVFIPNVNGSYTYSDFLSFAKNTPTTVSIAMGNPTLDFREFDSFGYVGDEWKVKPNLTLTYGLTYSFYGQPANLFNKNDVKIANSSTPFWNPALDQSITTFPKLPSQKKLFAPSVGFAWTPSGDSWLTGNGKLVLRGGYRFAYDPPFYNIYLNMASSAPQLLSQTTIAALPADPTGPNVRAALASELKTGVFDPRTFSQTKVAPNFGADKVNSWSFGVQRELAKNLVAEARYVGNHAYNLFQTKNANPYIKDLAADFPNLVPAGTTVCANGRVVCDSSLIRLRENSGYSFYNGLQTELRASNLFNQLAVQTAFTWSKTTDNSSEIYGSNVAGALSQNPFDTAKGEYGLSSLDIPKNWTLSFVEKLPFFKKQEGILGHIAGGWGVSGTYQLASGQPYTPIQYYISQAFANYSDYKFNLAYTGLYDNVRPFWGNRNAPASSVGIYAADACAFSGVGCSLASSQILDFAQANAGNEVVVGENARYIVNAPYAQQKNGTPFGNVGRNTARDYWTNISNATITKDIKVTEGVQAQFKTTLMNVFNHRNYSSVDTWIDDSYASLKDKGEFNAFGDPTYTSGGARTIIFGLTVRF